MVSNKHTVRTIERVKNKKIKVGGGGEGINSYIMYN